MHRIDTSTAQKDKFGAGKAGFTSGNPQTGVPATEVSSEILDAMQEELCAVIESAGITLDKARNNQLLSAIQASIYPVGAPIPWPLATPPSGFLLMNGASFNETTYPKLGLAYPSGVLPDLRGEFIRGWDNGRGVDSGRALLSSQTGMIESHAHRLTTGINTDATKDILGSLSGDPLAVKAVSGSTTVTFTSARLEATGGTETRPRNIAFNCIVRAA